MAAASVATDTASKPGGCFKRRAETPAAPDGDERWAHPAAAGRRAVDLMVPGISCAGCMAKIERSLGAEPGIAAVRVNLSLRRAHVEFDPAESSVAAVTDALGRLGYEAKPFDAAALAEIDRDSRGRDLLARLGVAGFAAMNVMLLSVSVWSGAEAATRDLLHWVSALIAIPAIAYAGRPFFASALSALRARRLNMDVPISLAVLLAAGTSLYEVSQSGTHAYFDAGLGLLFFLLLGRYLDHRTRAAARSAAAELTALSARSATVIGADGTRSTVAADAIAPGALVEVAPGERIPADGVVESGTSDLDRSLVTGESMPEPVGPEAPVHAGMLNLSGLLRIRASATGEDTLLAEIARMIEAAETGKTRYDRWADQAARIYAPGVHLVALAAFVGWVWATGDIRHSIAIASAVLIITCPCALGLAVPAVHAAAGGRLFRAGIFLKDGAALERLAAVDTVVFDKTGTLTDGRPRLADAPEPDDTAWPIAAAMAAASRHPLARALAEAAEARGVVPVTLGEIRETPGAGLEAWAGGIRIRLGSAAWTGAEPLPDTAVHLRIGDGTPLAFTFTEGLREDAPELCSDLRRMGFRVVLLSGDGCKPVARVAGATGIPDHRSGLTPRDKLDALDRLRAEGSRVLMVGDGINDAPALAAAHASMSPVSAAEVSRAAADLVFTGSRLAPVAIAIRTARTARHRAMQNFALAALYNACAIPLALAGMVTPLVAALAMSGSSIIVTLNAVRRWGDTGRGPT
ncbi:heavy metal translocating P-type ATPase [Paralimibaculum aggregatum]|uniref:Heavy metal translocating P-type ATPase n=2 Tax=Paralimibaculum aggregatum TaxID=3036245 RepID=A0ABQ6LMD4_9RHOB|nr:heavy metal translocating P-type ATPase [Limibaculum sp. NKW23]GMG83450.1 heavy metal translocating P-type ATPase [Limibaculum sp. NKW23]